MSAPSLSTSLNVKLSGMMFLQYAIWGAWLPLLWPYLSEHVGLDGHQIGMMFSVGAVGAIVAPFIAGQIADRYFNTEKFLGLSHLIGAVLVYQLATIESYWAFLAFSLLYSLIYSPTLSLTNSLAFHHLPDRDRDFGRVRVWGTVGWIVVGIGIGQWLAGGHTISDELATQRVFEEQFVDPEARQLNLAEVEGGRPLFEGLAPLTEGSTSERDPAALAAIEGALRALAAGDSEADVRAGLLVDGFRFSAAAQNVPIRAGQVKGMADAFRLSALLGALMGLFCFFLPKTPPAKGDGRNAAFAALGEVKRQPLITLFLLAVPVSCIHQFYFVHTAGFLGSYQLGAADALNRIFGVGGGGLMTVGQMTELGVLAAIPLVAGRLSRKCLLGIGLVAYGLRMALFAYVEAIPLPPIVTLVLGVGLHGLCFGCFIFVAFMVVDEETSPGLRASAQSLFNLVIIGVGIIVGSLVAGWVADWATVDGVMDYTKLFSVPMYASLACLLALFLFYPGGRRTVDAQTA
jgi:MFS family permease